MFSRRNQISADSERERQSNVLSGYRLRLDHFVQDIRYATRILRRSPAFAITAMLSLALGIGANTAIFSVLDTIMFRTLPVKDPGSLVIVRPHESTGNAIVSNPVFEEMQTRQQVCTGLLATSEPQRLTVQWMIAQLPQRVMGTLVSGNYFSVLGANITIGRGFAPRDEDPAAAGVAVISYGLWDRQFSRNSGVLGQTILINNKSLTIVGVAPSGFDGVTSGLASDVWVLLKQFRTAEDLRNRAGSLFQIMGRLRTAISREQAQVALTLLYQ